MIDIKQSLIKTLEETFNNTAYDQMPGQNFVTPSFFVKELLSSHQKETGDYIRSFYSFDIHYFPHSNRPKRECRNIEMELVKLFRFYRDLRLWPTSMAGEIIDNVLHFTIDFSIRYHVTMSDDNELFGDLEIRGDLIE